MPYAHALTIHISNSHAPSPVLFGRRRVRPLPSNRMPGLPAIRHVRCPPPSKMNRGRAGRCRVRAHSSSRERAQTESAQTHGPRRLATSRLVEADSAASPPVLRRPARGVCRFAPHRPRWTYLSGDPASPFELAGRLSTAVGPGRRCGPVTGCNATPSRGPVDTRLARRDGAAWTAGWGIQRRISDAPEPATAPRPASGDCRPLGSEGRDGKEYKPGLKAVK